MKTKNILTQFILTIAAVSWLWAGAARGADPITLTITATDFSGYEIPGDFSGLSYETYDVSNGDHWVKGNIFSPTNNQMLWLFENMGVHNLRIGGGTTEGTKATHLTDADIDNLFKFAQAADVNVIFSLQLMNGDANNDAVTAQYIWMNYAPELEFFSIGNEPDGGEKSYWSNNYANFESAWNSFYSTISASVPDALFIGPESCCDYTWATDFANDESGSVKLITRHNYFGGAGVNLTADEDVANMMSPTFMANAYNTELSGLSTVISDGFGFRFTETDDCTGGVPNASDGYASALWALDCMHWWASNSCAGLNFHNNEWLRTDTVYQDAHYGNLLVHPKGYALKAWDMGGHGYIVPLAASNPNGANVAAYAVGRGQDLYVTVINRHTVSGGSIAACTIVPNGFAAASVRAMYLTSASGNFEVTNDTSFGGAIITNNAQFVPGWQDLSPVANGQCVVNVSPAQAAVIHIQAASAYSNPIQVNNNGTLELFSISTNGDVFYRPQLTSHNLDSQGSSPANWGEGVDMGALGNGVAAIDAPVVAKNLDGTLEVFVPGSDGNLYDNVQGQPGGSWSGWYNIGGPGVTNLQVGINRDGSLNLFGIGNNGDIWDNTEAAPHVLGSTWMDWTDTAGVQPGLAVGQNLDGRLEVYGVNASGVLYHKWQSGVGSTNWATWASLGGAVKPSLQVVRDTTGDLNVFALDATSGNIDYIAQTAPGQSWGSWNTSALGSLPPGTTAVDPGFVVAQDNNGRFEIVAVLSDGNVYHNWFQSNGTWSGWNHSLGGAGTDPHLVTANTEDGRLQIFGNVYSPPNDIMSIWQTSPAGGWSSWTNFGSYRWHGWDNPGSGSGFTNSFAACSWGANRMDVFGVSSSDHNIYHNWWNGTAWQSSWELHSLTMAPTNGPAASANVNVSGREDIYYVGADGNLWHQWWSGSWSGWQNLGAPTGVKLVGTPSATSWAANRYDVFARGSDGNVYHVYYNGSWSAWENHSHNAAGLETNDVASCSWSANRLDIYTLGYGNGQIYHQYWDGSYHPSQTTWAQDLPETSFLGLGASSWGTGRIDLFGNTGSAIAHNWYDFNTWTANWNQTLTPPATPISSPCATSWCAGRIDMFVPGSDGKCYHTYYW